MQAWNLRPARLVPKCVREPLASHEKNLQDFVLERELLEKHCSKPQMEVMLPAESKDTMPVIKVLKVALKYTKAGGTCYASVIESHEPRRNAFYDCHG